MATAGGTYTFGEFRLDTRRHQLLRGGEVVPLTPRAFDLLLALVTGNGSLLTKQQLMARVWGDAVVEENNLNQTISALRKALEEGKGGRRLIETVPRLGYRFVADVRVDAGENGAPGANEIQSGSTSAPTRMRRAVAITLAVTALIGTGVAIVGFGGRLNPNPGTGSAAAHEAYLKGRFFWSKRTAESQQKAIEYFLQATRADPTYARAYAGLADAYLFSTNPLHYQQTQALVKPMALRALALDDTLAEAHASLAYFMSAVEWDWQGAEREFQRAIALDPSYVTARHWHAYHLAALGRLDEALAEIRHAQKLDPVSPIIATDVGHILYFARQYDQAIEQYRKALELEPKFGVAHWRLGEAYAVKGMYREALVALQEAAALGDFRPAWLAYTYGRAGERDKAQYLRNEVQGLIRTDGLNYAYSLALINMALGDHGAAFDSLEDAYRAHSGELVLIKVEPMLDPLRSDPRYSALLRRMGL